MGSARRAGWFRGRFIVSLWREAVFPKARGGRPPLAGRGSALRFRAGRGLCRRVVKAMTAGEKYRVTLTSYSSPEGRYHHPRPKGPLPPFAQPAAAGGHNLQPRRGWLPSPLNLLNPLNPLNPGRKAALLYPLYPLQITLKNCYFLYIIQIKYSNRRSHEFLIHEIFPHAG